MLKINMKYNRIKIYKYSVKCDIMTEENVHITIAILKCSISRILQFMRIYFSNQHTQKLYNEYERNGQKESFVTFYLQFGIVLYINKILS